MTTPTQPTTEQVRAAWDALAPRFDEHITPHSMRFGEELLTRLEPGPGTRFLDVAAGSGALAIPAARQGAQVVAVDLAPAMTERLEARARVEGLVGLDARVMDGHALDLPDDAFDAAASLNGVSLLPDLHRGLRELVRVVRPGGRALIASFGPLEKVEFITFVASALQTVVPELPPLPSDPPPLPFQVADPQAMHEALEAAGFTDVTVEAVVWRMPFESAAQVWDGFTSGNPIAVQLTGGLTAEQIASVREILDGMLRERSGGEPGGVLTADVTVGLGTV